MKRFAVACGPPGKSVRTGRQGPLYLPLRNGLAGVPGRARPDPILIGGVSVEGGVLETQRRTAKGANFRKVQTVGVCTAFDPIPGDTHIIRGGGPRQVDLCFAHDGRRQRSRFAGGVRIRGGLSGRAHRAGILADIVRRIRRPDPILIGGGGEYVGVLETQRRTVRGANFRKVRTRKIRTWTFLVVNKPKYLFSAQHW